MEFCNVFFCNVLFLADIDKLSARKKKTEMNSNDAVWHPVPAAAGNANFSQCPLCQPKTFSDRSEVELC